MLEPYSFRLCLRDPDITRVEQRVQSPQERNYPLQHLTQLYCHLWSQNRRITGLCRYLPERNGVAYKPIRHPETICKFKNQSEGVYSALQIGLEHKLNTAVKCKSERSSITGIS
jgi:hypothetical protein